MLRAPVLLLLLLALGGALACEREPEAPKLPGDDIVLAEVDGVPVTKLDVDLFAKKMFGDDAASDLPADARKRMLESIVQTRVVAQKQEAELSPEQRALLDRKVAAFREEQLLRLYLTKHTKREGVSREMIESYYKAHPERFGATKARTYELLATSRELAESERPALIAALKDPASHADWQVWAEQLRKQAQPVTFQRGQGADAVLDPALNTVIERLRVGEASALTFIRGRAYLVRVTSEHSTPPKALTEVSAEIRKSLAPQQMKESVEQAFETVMKDAKVAYR